MGFWDLSEGGNAADTGTEYEIPGGGNFDPIPNGSSVLAIVDKAEWANSQQDGSGADYVKLTWSIVSPDEYKNRKIFHKLWVTDFDPSAKDQDKATKKRDKARRMLAAIDANAGGKLTKKTGIPSDDDLAFALCNKPMIITLMVWEMDDRSTGGTVSGNWVSAVAPKSAGIDVKPAAPSAPKQQSRQSAPASRDLDDEVPF